MRWASDACRSFLLAEASSNGLGVLSGEGALDLGGRGEGEREGGFGEEERGRGRGGEGTDSGLGEEHSERGSCCGDEGRGLAEEDAGGDREGGEAFEEMEARCWGEEEPSRPLGWAIRARGLVLAASPMAWITLVWAGGGEGGGCMEGSSGSRGLEGLGLSLLSPEVGVSSCRQKKSRGGQSVIRQAETSEHLDIFTDRSLKSQSNVTLRRPLK